MGNSNTPHSRALRAASSAKADKALRAKGYRTLSVLLPPEVFDKLTRIAPPGGGKRQIIIKLINDY